jgi:hypothetical protein
MNKTAIKNFAIQSRVDLIQGVTQKAFELGITHENILNNTIASSDAFVVHGKVLDATMKRQREQVIHQIQHKGFTQLIEEVAYTWFNRFIALRFMEVNQYLPSGIRVFTNHTNEFKPELVDQALNLSFRDLDRNKVLNYLDHHQEEALYKYLLILQCNEMNKYLPEMFEKIDNYTEVLLPDGLLRNNGVIGNMISIIEENDWKDQVQIIGWLYQYYNTELKQEVFDGLKKNIKITKENMPAATQLFTPDWIVRYMVENSLGRLWVEGHPNPTLQANWKYYVEEVQQEAEVEKQLQQIREEYKALKPEDIKVIDPCMGSGHILVYAFDVLMQIYLSAGYLESDAAKLILEKNLYGLDIDQRAYQLSYFSLMMKARKHNSRILSSGIKPQVYEPTGYPDGMEYGSLIKVDKLEPAPEAPQSVSLFDESYETKLNTWNFRRLLSQKYDVVVTNPPYAGAGGVNSRLGEYLKSKYPDSKSDLFAAFMEKCFYMTKAIRFSAMITQQAWMFLSSYEKLRSITNSLNTYQNMIHLGNGSFGFADFGLTAFIHKKVRIKNYLSKYYRLVDENNPEWKEEQFLLRKFEYLAVSDNFSKIPGSPVAYWLNKTVYDHYTKGKTFGEIGYPKVGMQTSNNDRFLRLWYEVCFNEFEGSSFGLKWIKYLKGGSFRRWYGNLEYLLMYNYDPSFILKQKNARVLSLDFLDKPKCTWTDLTSGSISFRIAPKDTFNDISGHCFYPRIEDQLWLLGYSNTKFFQMMKKVFNSTFHCQVGDISKIVVPVLSQEIKVTLSNIVEECVSFSKSDWDSFETSWDFAKHPFLTHKNTLSDNSISLIQGSFKAWELYAESQFYQLKVNEEELNRIFIEFYGLQDELIPDVEEKYVTVRKADLTRDVKSFISYIIGCVFGRYSLDEEGLFYAGGEWKDSRYTTFKPVKDNIIQINEDIFDEDSLLGRIIEFVKVVYGESTLEENLSFLASALGTSGQSAREKIVKYLLNDFYNDHVKVYQKRPIYWLFDSGKANGFKALIYLHRYSSETLVKLRLDYVHPTQDALRSEISSVSRELERTSDARLKAKYVTQLKDLKDKADEVLKYEQKLHHLVDKKIVLDLDDGVVVNYAKFDDLVAKIK